MPWVAVALTVALLPVGCSGGGSPTAPSSVLTPADVAGSWTGWMDTGNWSRVIMDADIAQSGGTVTGTWRAASATGLGWTGTWSGTVTATSFSGTSTISMANPNGDGSTCTGSTPVTGNATGTLTWTGPGFTGACSGMPEGLTFVFNRRP